MSVIGLFFSPTPFLNGKDRALLLSLEAKKEVLLEFSKIITHN